MQKRADRFEKESHSSESSHYWRNSGSSYFKANWSRHPSMTSRPAHLSASTNDAMLVNWASPAAPFFVWLTHFSEMNLDEAEETLTDQPGSTKKNPAQFCKRVYKVLPSPSSYIIGHSSQYNWKDFLRSHNGNAAGGRLSFLWSNKWRLRKPVKPPEIVEKTLWSYYFCKK